MIPLLSLLFKVELQWSGVVGCVRFLERDGGIEGRLSTPLAACDLKWRRLRLFIDVIVYAFHVMLFVTTIEGGLVVRGHSNCCARRSDIWTLVEVQVS